MPVPPVPTLQTANLSFNYGNGRVSSFFGIYHQSNKVAKNHTDLRVRIDVDNLYTLECTSRPWEACVSPDHPGSYRVVCRKDDVPALVEYCMRSANSQLQLLILCVSVSRAEELLTTDLLTFDSDQLTVVLVNRSLDRDVPCPLFKWVSNEEITASTNVSVTVTHSGTCKLHTTLPSHEVTTGSTQSQDANLALLSLFAVGLIAAVAGIWIAVVYLKRRFKLCKRIYNPQVKHTVATYITNGYTCVHAAKWYTVCLWVGVNSNPCDVCHYCEVTVINGRHAYMWNNCKV